MAQKTCNNPDCRFDEDQQCVEGLDPATCSFRRGRSLIESAPEAAADDFDYGEAVADDEGLAVYSGAKLTLAEAGRLLFASDANVVSLVAHRGAGKTSLLASTYELFLEGIGKQRFEGSRTLRGFEVACHLSRAASGRTTPEQERTRTAEGLGFYHLQFGGSGSKPSRGLLLGDRPGENYRDAAANLANATALTEIPFAGVIAVLVDGAALADSTRRHLPAAQLGGALSAMCEAGLFSHRPKFSFVLTKADVGRRAGIAEQVETRFQALVDALIPLLQGQFTDVRRHTTVASPEDEAHANRGEGVADLVTFWLEDRIPKPEERKYRPPVRSFARFDRTAMIEQSRA